MFAFALVGTAFGGTPARWPDDAFPIPYSVQADLGAAGLDDEAALFEIEQAFTVWEAVTSDGVPCLPGAFDVSKERVKDAAFGDVPDQRNTVFVVVKGWPKKYEGEATAVNLVSDADNVIVEGDIGLNAEEFPFTLEGHKHKTLDLQATVTHAVGHLLGLEDSKDNGATMNPLMVGRPQGRSLETSDEEALCALYPPAPIDTGSAHSEQGDECTRNEDCTDGFVCVVDNGDEYCATRCGAEGECPSGTSCEDPGSGSPVCIAERDTGCGVVPRTGAGFVGLVLAALAVRGRTRR